MLSTGLEKSLKIKKIGEVCEKTLNVPQESFLQSENVSYSVLLEGTCLQGAPKMYHIRCSLKTRAFIKAGLLYVQKTLKALPYTNFLSENAFLCSCEFGSGFSGIVQFSLFDIV